MGWVRLRLNWGSDDLLRLGILRETLKARACDARLIMASDRDAATASVVRIRRCKRLYLTGLGRVRLRLRNRWTRVALRKDLLRLRLINICIGACLRLLLIEGIETVLRHLLDAHQSIEIRTHWRRCFCVSSVIPVLQQQHFSARS